MANQQPTSQKLLQLWELFGTVAEGAAYLAGHPDSADMRRDVSTGLQALHTHLQTDLQTAVLPPEGKQNIEQAKNAFSTLYTQLQGGRWNKACTEQLEAAAVALAEALARGLCERLQEQEYLTREQVEPLFAFCDAAPHGGPAIYQLIFAVCERAAVSMPQAAFDWTVRAMEEQPNLLSGANNPHPGYHYAPAPQRTFDRCPICGGAGRPYYRALSYSINTFVPPHLPAKLWMRCGGCGNLYTWKYPEEFLTQAAHPDFVQPDATKALTAVRPESGATLAIWSTILNRLHGYTAGKDLLEVGIGEGCLLAVALEMGYRPDAVEIVREAAQEVADILQIPIWNGDFLDYHPDKRYDVIIMGDVIEHVTDPERALHSACDLLAEDGVLWLSTPNFESSFSRLMKFRDPMWMEPFHISYFSFAGLRTLAEKCGFAVREYQVSNRYNGSMELILTKTARGE